MITTKYLIALFVSLSCLSCNNESVFSDLEEQICQENDTTYYGEGRTNHDSTKIVLPERTINDSLKILAIGNSFTDDATAYLPNLIECAKLARIKVAKIVLGGTSLEFHYNHAMKNDDVYDYYISEGGKSFKNLGKSSFYEAICDDHWDIVILQQLSQLSGQHNTYQPYLDSLIMFVHQQLPKTIIGWQMTWAYSSNSTHAAENG